MMLDILPDERNEKQMLAISKMRSIQLYCDENGAKKTILYLSPASQSKEVSWPHPLFLFRQACNTKNDDANTFPSTMTGMKLEKTSVPSHLRGGVLIPVQANNFLGPCEPNDDNLKKYAKIYESPAESMKRARLVDSCNEGVAATSKDKAKQEGRLQSHDSGSITWLKWEFKHCAISTLKANGLDQRKNVSCFGFMPMLDKSKRNLLGHGAVTM